MLSERIGTLSPSLTIAISSLARDLKAQGKDILSFSAGEPDFATPRAIKDEAIKAINDGYTQYTAVPGCIEVLEAVATKLKRDNGLDYVASDIIVSNGAKQSLFNLFQVTLNPGDEVIIPAPYWVTYPELVKYASAIPVVIETDEIGGFKITAEQLKAAITPKTKMLILTTPSNPTGSVYSKEELTTLAEVLEGTDVIVASDEMYEKLVYNIDFVAGASVKTCSKEQSPLTVLVNLWL